MSLEQKNTFFYTFVIIGHIHINYTPLILKTGPYFSAMIMLLFICHNWEKYFISLFHVSEHLGHSKAIKKSRKKTEIVWSGGTSPP